MCHQHICNRLSISLHCAPHLCHNVSCINWITHESPGPNTILHTVHCACLLRKMGFRCMPYIPIHDYSTYLMHVVISLGLAELQKWTNNVTNALNGCSWRDHPPKKRIAPFGSCFACFVRMGVPSRGYGCQFRGGGDLPSFCRSLPTKGGECMVCFFLGGGFCTPFPPSQYGSG